MAQKGSFSYERNPPLDALTKRFGAGCLRVLVVLKKCIPFLGSLKNRKFLANINSMPYVHLYVYQQGGADLRTTKLLGQLGQSGIEPLFRTYRMRVLPLNYKPYIYLGQ